MDTRPNRLMTKNADEKFCSDCGSVIKIRAEICPKCGVRQLAFPGASASVQVDAKSERSKFLAAMLAIFLGGLGVHKFYLGRPGWGILYLLFCWSFVPVVLGFLEGLNFLLMSEKTFNKRYA